MKMLDPWLVLVGVGRQLCNCETNGFAILPPITFQRKTNTGIRILTPPSPRNVSF